MWVVIIRQVAVKEGCNSSFADEEPFCCKWIMSACLSIPSAVGKAAKLAVCSDNTGSRSGPIFDNYCFL